MDPRILRGFLGLGVFLAFSGVLVTFLQTPDSAEFYISICSAAMGLTLVGMVVLLSRWSQRG